MNFLQKSSRCFETPENRISTVRPARRRFFSGRIAGAIFTAMVLLTTPSVRAVPPVDGNGFFHLNSGQSDYVGYAPDTYDPSVPISLFVWMHGCGGEAEGDMYAIAPYATRANQSYIAISIGGRDGACWDPNVDTAKVLAAITDVSRYFTIDPRKIYIGGYSSGGDLAYRTAFENTLRFAGILAENTAPFRDTGATQASLLASASWKINVAHLAHLSDMTYPIDEVRSELDVLRANGFPVTAIEKPGTHYDDDAGNTGTNYDLIHSLLPFLDAGWMSPAVPALAVNVTKKIVTTKASYKLKGTVPDGATVMRIEVRVGNAKKYKKAKGVTNWSFLVHLKVGRNKIIARAVGPDGSLSSPIKVVIVRKPTPKTAG